MSWVDSIVFLSRDLLPVAAVAAVLVVLVSVWGYGRSRLPMRLKLTGITLKTLGILLLGFCLLEPQWVDKKAKPGANFIAVLADNSQGMEIRDAGSATSRAEELAANLKPQPGDWQEALDENFQIRRYSFDTRLRTTGDFDSLDFKGRASALVGSTRNLGQRFSGRPLAGILLFSDGNATDIESLNDGLGQMPPVYPVVMGKQSPIKDISIASVQVTSSTFEDAPVVIHCQLAATDFPAEKIVARLLDADGKVLDTQYPGLGQAMKVKFEVKPESLGVSFYTVELGQTAQTEGEAGEEEATLANNRRVVAVERRKEPFRILYVAGRPNWEYKFLKRALDDDPQLFGVACRVVAHPPGAAGDGMQRYLDWQNSLHTPEEIARDRFIESPVLHPSVMMRTAPLREQLAGWQDRGWAEDWDLFLRALAAGLRISRVDDPLLAWRVHDRQATRADPRYTEERLLDCRAHHLSRHLCAAFSDRPVWILGAGPVGKSLCKALAGEGLEVGGLVDVDPRKVGGRVRAGRREWPVVAMETLFDVTPRPFAVWAVGRPGGRAGLRALMRDRGWEEGHDFVCAA